MVDRKFKLFRLFGFEVALDPSWIVLAIQVAWSLNYPVDEDEKRRPKEET